MNYAYKPTTNGRAAIAACWALEKPLHIVRVAFGSGKVSEGTNLADVHQLLEYVSDGAVTNRLHKDDRFELTIQFANDKHPEVKTFQLSEFIVYVQDPQSGGETDLLYGTMGDYSLPVPAYNPAFPASVFNFPLELILSDEINVHISAPAGLVTYDELLEAIENHNIDPAAHAALLAAFRSSLWRPIRTRERDPAKPAYGLGNSAVNSGLYLNAGTYTGKAEISAIVSGVEYDARNMSASGDNVPDGTLILTKLEE